MSSLIDKILALSADSEGSELCRIADATSRKHGMDDMLDGGAALGLSGGADSVFLLCYLYLRRRERGIRSPLLAIHVNHGIRGASAERDAVFSSEICRELDIPFILETASAPIIAAECGIGIEEAARKARYSIFEEILSGRNYISCVALAHNSTDNVETVVMNLLRGSGLRGMCGIPAVRDKFVRPLLDIPKGRIIALLDKLSIPYVHDETNDTDDYTRNYVRHNILPHFESISPSYEATLARTVENMRSAYSLVRSLSDPIVASCHGDTFSVAELRGFHYEVFADALSRIVFEKTGEHPERAHIDAVYRAIDKDAFSVSLFGKYDFVCQRKVCFFQNKIKKHEDEVIIELHFGENIIHGTNVTVFVGDPQTFKDISSNIYKKSIYTDVRGDIMNNGVFLRFKRDGDAYVYGGHTRRLKKVFNDRNIPPFMRSRIPLICDSEGILWVVGLPIRDGAVPTDNDGAVRITVCFGEVGSELFSALPYKTENT